MKYIFVDTETGGLDESAADVLQLAWTLTDEEFRPLRTESRFLPQTLPVTEKSLELHGLTKEFLKENAEDPEEVYSAFLRDLSEADCYVGHYIPFDRTFIVADSRRRAKPATHWGIGQRLAQIRCIDTKRDFIQLCSDWQYRHHPGPYLEEMCRFLGVRTANLRFHRADSDVEAMLQCMRQIKRLYSDTIPN